MRKKKVHLVCGKVSKYSAGCWILGVYSSKKKALDACKRMDTSYPEIYHYTCRATVI